MLRAACVATAYVVAGKLGIGLSVASGVITPVWAPSGIALAALLVFGRSLWPAVLLAALITNATSGAEPAVALGIAVGNTLEGLAGSHLLERAGFRVDLGRVRDVLALVILGAGLSSLIAATNGVAVLSLAGTPEGSLASDWLLWWFGDAVGILLVTPFLLLCHARRRDRWPRARLAEAALLVVSLAGVCTIVFLGGAERYPYLLFPLALWGVLRFHQFGAALCALVVGAMATWGTLAGTVPVDIDDPAWNVQVIQALIGVVAISLLVFGAALEERETAKYTAEHTAARLREAQALTHIGSWEWDPATGAIEWSDELYRMFGLTPQSGAVTLDSFVERVHPDDKRPLAEAVTRAYETRAPFEFEHRIVLVDGRTRMVQGRGRMVSDEAGEPARMVGTGQDVTEQRQAEALRADILSAVSHELRTPLASILNFGVTLRDRQRELDEGAVTKLVDQIVKQARRMDRLLADLLEIDRIRHGRVLAARQPTDVAELVREIASTYREAGHAIVVHARPTTADVDPTKVERIVDNLLINAVTHTPPRTPVALRLERRGDDLLIAVDDAGPGVPDDFKTSVFDIFDRGSKAMSNHPGSGIGLSLVARFAALHGGRAWIEDRTGGGTSVRVLLPDCVLAQSAELAAMTDS